MRIVALVIVCLFFFTACDGNDSNESATSGEPASSAAVDVDAIFADMFREHVPELSAASDNDLATIGKAVCSDFDRGSSFEGELISLSDSVTMHQAASIIGMSIAAYCPRHNDLLS